MSISNKQLKKNMENFVGKDVLLLDPHPWAGEKGQTVRVETAKGMGKPGMVVKLDNGTECFVFEASQIMFITHTIPVKRE